MTYWVAEEPNNTENTRTIPTDISNKDNESTSFPRSFIYTPLRGG